MQEPGQAQARKDRESPDAPWFQDGTLESVRVRENPIGRYGAGMRLPTLLALTLALTGCEAIIICTGDQVKEGTLCVDPVDGGGDPVDGRGADPTLATPEGEPCTSFILEEGCPCYVNGDNAECGDNLVCRVEEVPDAGAGTVNQLGECTPA